MRHGVEEDSDDTWRDDLRAFAFQRKLRRQAAESEHLALHCPECGFGAHGGPESEHAGDCRKMFFPNLLVPILKRRNEFVPGALYLAEPGILGETPPPVVGVFRPKLREGEEDEPVRGVLTFPLVDLSEVAAALNAMADAVHARAYPAFTASLQLVFDQVGPYLTTLQQRGLDWQTVRIGEVRRDRLPHVAFAIANNIAEDLDMEVRGDLMAALADAADWLGPA